MATNQKIISEMRKKVSEELSADARTLVARIEADSKTLHAIYSFLASQKAA